MSTSAKTEVVADLVQQYKTALRSVEKIKLQLDALGVDIAEDAFTRPMLRIGDHPEKPGRTLVTASPQKSLAERGVGVSTSFGNLSQQ